MKKVIALVFALVMIMGLSVTSLAVPSATAKSEFKVSFRNGSAASQTTNTVKVSEDGKFTATVDSAQGTFNEWVIYKADGTVAVAGVDYTVVSGSLKDANLVVKPLTDIIICGNYNGVVTKPILDGSSSSPKTGDFTVMYLAAVMMAAGACGFVAKKQLAK